MSKKSIIVILSFLIIWIIVTIIAVTWGTRFDWPDNVHIDYGVPFVWSTNTLSTISGAVNLWIVDITALIMNLVFWLGITVIIEAVLLYFYIRK